MKAWIHSQIFDWHQYIHARTSLLCKVFLLKFNQCFKNYEYDLNSSSSSMKKTCRYLMWRLNLPNEKNRNCLYLWYNIKIIVTYWYWHYIPFWLIKSKLKIYLIIYYLTNGWKRWYDNSIEWLLSHKTDNNVQSNGQLLLSKRTKINDALNRS